MSQDKPAQNQKTIDIGINHDINQMISQNSFPPPWYYTCAISLLKPLYRMKLWIKSKKNKNYKKEVADRFGKRYEGKNEYSGRQTIWCHAVSLGETNTIAPVLRKLMKEGYNVWLTNTTHTGYARTIYLFQDYIEKGQLQHSYVPVDTKHAIKKFLSYVQPSVALFVETELWANILYQLSERNIPSILINARLSEQSFIRYQKINKTSRSMMENIGLIISQDADSAKRFRLLGADSSKISVSGSLKWTVDSLQEIFEDEGISSIPQYMNIKQSVVSRAIWVAASTHDGEELISLMAQKKLLNNHSVPNPLLIIVPRHPERFDEVAKCIEDKGLNYCRRSLGEVPSDITEVYLADTMGELLYWYQLANVAFVGGSMINLGGHNPIEALVQETPVIMGQFTYSLESIITELANKGVLYKLQAEYKHRKGSPLDKNILDSLSEQLYQQVLLWLLDINGTKLLGKQGKALVDTHQKVIDRQVQMILQILKADLV